MRKSLLLVLLVGCATGPRAPAVSPREPAISPPTKVASQTSASPVVEPPEPVRQLQERARTASHAFEIVQSLSDEAGPRPAGSLGDKRAVDWAVRTMPTLGLKRVHAERVTVRPWERGVETASIVAPVRQPLEITALGGSTATREAGIEADVVEADSIASLDKLGRAAVEGKIVFLNTPMRRTRDGAGYGEAVVSRFAGAHHAQALGAKAVVIRSIGTDSNRLPHTGGKSKDEHEIPAGALSIPDADLLHRVLAAHGTARLHLTLTPRVLPETETANVMGCAGARSPR